MLRQLWQRLRGGPELPDRAVRFLATELPYTASLSNGERRRLHRLVARFLRQKNFEAAGGLRLDGSVKWTIAGQACLMHLGIPDPLYPTLRTVIVYPGTYRVVETVHQPEGVELDVREFRAGESWQHGTLILSWSDVLDGLADPQDGWNVVFHEFAHQLDSETGETNGAPALPSIERYQEWQAAFQQAYSRLRQRAAHSIDQGLFDFDDAESPAEFFAAASELFFERPADLRADEPKVFEQLVEYYGQIPEARLR